VSGRYANWQRDEIEKLAMRVPALQQLIEALLKVKRKGLSYRLWAFARHCSQRMPAHPDKASRRIGEIFLVRMESTGDCSALDCISGEDLTVGLRKT
jgi:hypothetical protein